MSLPGKDARLTPYGGNNFGMPLDLVDGMIVPTDLFFVRSNGSIPVHDAESWRLSIDGHVENPIELALNQLKTFPHRELTSFLECAGNSRTRFDPIPEGTPWLNDAIGNATWEGVRLRDVLELAVPRAGAVDIVATGFDEPAMERGLPLTPALDPNVLLAWSMNGELLTAPHGAPLRLVVPGWGGIASTKWLRRLTLLDRPFTGYYNATNYVMISRSGEHLTPVREMPVKSIIASPTAGARLSAGRQTANGYAWSGFGGIERVELSVDGGDRWFDAQISDRAGALSWVRWEFEWVAIPGVSEIQVRATDSRTLTQPVRPQWNAKGYQMNGVHGVIITVE